MLYERKIRKWLKTSPRKAKPVRVCRAKDQNLAIAGVSSGKSVENGDFGDRFKMKNAKIVFPMEK